MRSEAVRGIALGLWILTGLAFLVGALLPGSTGERVLGPSLLALSCLTTALTVPRSAINGLTSVRPRRSRIVQGTLAAMVAILTFGIALTVIREGDQRSWIFVVFTALAALVLYYHGGEDRT